MKARYIGTGYGDWKGITIAPGLEFDVPERLQGMVAINRNFEVLSDVTEEPTEAPRKRGRPRKSDENES